MKKTILLFAVLAFCGTKGNSQTVTDIDGNVYNTIIIGTQIWMKENLKVTHYRNSIQIPNVTNATAWSSLTTGARCYYNNDSATNNNIYGGLYNWYSVNDTCNICPNGWHVPSDAEWNIMEKHLDNTVDTTDTGPVGTDIGDQLKESGTSHWASGNYGTNSSNFTALPGASRGEGGFGGISYFGLWWTATAYGVTDALGRYLENNFSIIGKAIYHYVDGLSVRCIMDSLATQINVNSINKDILIFPNPAIDKVYINCAEKKEIKIQIYNVVGECVLQRELNIMTNEIDISSFTKGIYILILTSSNGTIEKKILKE
jgi:uncharacterized protein (TIGR02145 family)